MAEEIVKGKVITKRPDGSTRVVTVNVDPSKTDQQWKKDCDVNHIVAKFLKTRQITHLNQNQGTYADVSQIRDLEQCLITVEKARSAFASLPAKIRNRFSNDPQKFIEFMQDSSKLEESYELGVRKRPEVEEEVQPPVVPPTPPEGGA